MLSGNSVRPSSVCRRWIPSSRWSAPRTAQSSQPPFHASGLCRRRRRREPAAGCCSGPSPTLQPMSLPVPTRPVCWSAQALWWRLWPVHHGTSRLPSPGTSNWRSFTSARERLNTDDTDEHRSKAKMNMDEGQVRGKHDDLTQKIIGVFYEVYNELGYGFLETVYREAMRLALIQAALHAAAEVPIQVRFRGELVGIFRADLIVNDTVLIELKACEALAREHESQTLNYLRATNTEVALLVNFGPTPLFKRLVMDNERKKSVSKSIQSMSIGVKPFADAEVVS